MSVLSLSDLPRVRQLVSAIAKAKPGVTCTTYPRRSRRGQAPAAVLALRGLLGDLPEGSEVHIVLVHSRVPRAQLRPALRGSFMNIVQWMNK